MDQYASIKLTVLSKKIQLVVAKFLYLIPPFLTSDHLTSCQKMDIHQLMLHFPSLAEAGCGQ